LSKLAGFAYRPARPIGRKATAAVAHTEKSSASAPGSDAVTECPADLAEPSSAELKRRALATAAFKARLIKLGWSVPHFARMTKSCERTVSGWTSPTGIPPQGWAEAWLDLAEAVPEARAWLEAQHPKPPSKPRGKPFKKAASR
jgi:hypothetical protein